MVCFGKNSNINDKTYPFSHQTHSICLSLSISHLSRLPAAWLQSCFNASARTPAGSSALWCTTLPVSVCVCVCDCGIVWLYYLFLFFAHSSHPVYLSSLVCLCTYWLGFRFSGSGIRPMAVETGMTGRSRRCSSRWWRCNRGRRIRKPIWQKKAVVTQKFTTASTWLGPSRNRRCGVDHGRTA